MKCNNCNNEIKKNYVKCKFCGNLICRECAGMSSCQECYQDGCDNCLEQCPICLENFCYLCFETHLESELHLTDKLDKLRLDISQSNIPNDSKMIILERINKEWFKDKWLK